jgi:hypothetical protein
MLNRVGRPSKLHAIAVALRAAAALDPYPRLAQVLFGMTLAADQASRFDPYPRLARFIQRSTIRQSGSLAASSGLLRR